MTGRTPIWPTPPRSLRSFPPFNSQVFGEEQRMDGNLPAQLSRGENRWRRPTEEESSVIVWLWRLTENQITMNSLGLIQVSLIRNLIWWLLWRQDSLWIQVEENLLSLTWTHLAVFLMHSETCCYPVLTCWPHRTKCCVPRIIFCSKVLWDCRSTLNPSSPTCRLYLWPESLAAPFPCWQSYDS